MARGKKQADGAAPKVIKPVLLAGFIGLGWVALYRGDGSEIDAPDWGVFVILAVRLVVGFVGGWIAISLLQVVFRFAGFGAPDRA